MSHSILSRRSFLKAIGVTSVAATVSSVSIPQAVSAAAIADSEDYARALAIAQTAPNVQQTLSELATQGYGFDLTNGGFIRSPDHSALVGLAFKQVTRPRRDTGADLVLTIDLEAGALTFLEQVLGHMTKTQMHIQNKVIRVSNQVATIAIDTKSLALESLARTTQIYGDVLPPELAIETTTTLIQEPPGSRVSGSRYSAQECRGCYDESATGYQGCCGSGYCCCYSSGMGYWCGFMCVCIEGYNLKRGCCYNSTGCTVSCGPWTNVWYRYEGCCMFQA